MKLVVTPQPRPTESLVGYLLRLTDANGYPGLRYVAASIGSRWTFATPAALDPTPLADLAGLTESQIRRLTMIPEGGGRGMRRILGIDLPRNEISIEHPKVCPQCLAEHGSCEAFWDLAQAVACPIHGTSLVSECPHCRKPLGWQRGKVAQCPCGADLTTIVAPKTPAAINSMMAVMRCLLYRDAHEAPMPEGMTHLKSLGLAQLCKLLWVMSSDLRNRAGVRNCPKARCKYGAERERVAAALCDWPQGFRKFLSETYGPQMRGAHVPPSFPRTFSWLFSRLITKEMRSSGVTNMEDQPYSFLVEEVCRFGAKFWLHGIVATKVAEGRRDARVSARWGSRLEAAKTLGVQLSTLNKLIKKGAIPTRKVSASKHRGTAVDLDAISRLIGRDVREVVNMRRAAKTVGVSISILQEIRKGNLCGLEPRLTFPLSVDEAEVEMLATRLRRLAESQVEMHDEGFITIRQGFITHAATVRERALFFDQLLSNPPWVVGCTDADAWEDRLQVRQQTFDSFFALGRGESRFMSMADTAKRLNCVNNVVVALRREGHLQSACHQGRLRPTIASVCAFDRSYEAATAIARRIGVTSTWLYWHGDFDTVRHLRIQSSRHTSIFVHRSDVASLERRMRALVRATTDESSVRRELSHPAPDDRGLLRRSSS